MTLANCRSVFISRGVEMTISPPCDVEQGEPSLPSELVADLVYGQMIEI